MGNITCSKACVKIEKDTQYDYNSSPIQREEIFFEDTTLKQGNFNTFVEKFDKKIKYIGKYVNPQDFDNLIPAKARLYMIENVLDLPRYLPNKGETYQVKPVEFQNGNIYNGNWNWNYKMEGYGQYFLKEQKLFVEGIWDDGKLIFGRVFFPNEDIYEGQIQNSLFNGKGKYISKSGEIYSGDYLNGEKTGRGKFIFQDGTIYDGEILNGKFKGQGNIKWVDGTEYNGIFNGCILNGYGELIGSQGDKYEGNFTNNKFNGKGVYTFNNGSSYGGDFEMGVKNGRGVFKRNDGFTYDGEWLNDLPHGFGKVAYDGCVIKCIWRVGNVVEHPTFEQGTPKNFNISNLNFHIDKFRLCPDLYSHIEKVDNSNRKDFGPSAMPNFLSG